MTHTVWIENARRREIAAVVARVNARNVAPEIDVRLAQVYDAVHSVVGAATGRTVVIYHDTELPADVVGQARDVRIEVGVECYPFPDSGTGVRASHTPEGLVATTEHVGAYDRLTQAHLEIRTWCRANGWVLAGVHWEVYGSRSAHPEQCRTGVYYLLR